MGTEVLRPQDCLLLRASPSPSPALRNPRPLRRRRDPSPKHPAKPRMVVGQVTILRRGESVEASKARTGEEAVAAGVGGGWDPAMIPREVRPRPGPAPLRTDVYAGSACALSPSPRALPLPSFSRRKEGSSAAAAAVDCSATRDLRRLLRLE